MKIMDTSRSGGESGESKKKRIDASEGGVNTAR